MSQLVDRQSPLALFFSAQQHIMQSVLYVVVHPSIRRHQSRWPWMTWNCWPSIIVYHLL